MYPGKTVGPLIGKAVAFHQVCAGVPGERVADRSRKRSRTDDGQPQAGDVGVDGHLRQRGVDGGHSRHRGDAVTLDELPEHPEERAVPVSERAGPDHVLAAQQRGEQHDHHGVGVEQRQGGE